MSAGAILLCAGAGARLGGGIEKSLVALAGRPLFAWSLDALARCTAVEAIVVVGPPGKLEAMKAADGVRQAIASPRGYDEAQRRNMENLTKRLER